MSSLPELEPDDGGKCGWPDCCWSEARRTTIDEAIGRAGMFRLFFFSSSTAYVQTAFKVFSGNSKLMIHHYVSQEKERELFKRNRINSQSLKKWMKLTLEDILEPLEPENMYCFMCLVSRVMT